MQKFKSINKLRTYLSIIVLLLIGTTFLVVPSFIYNEYEFRFRKELAQAFDLSLKIDDAVQQRRYGLANGAMTDEEHVELGKQVEASILRMQTLLLRGNEIMETQGKVPFVPRKYREYHAGKKVAIAEYTRLSGEFLYKKQNDHMLTDTMVVISRLDAALTDISSPTWWDTATSLPEKILMINTNNQKLIENDFISEDHYAVMKKSAGLFQFMYDQSQNISKNDSWDVFDIAKFNSLSEERSSYDLGASILETFEKSDKLTAKYQAGVAINDTDLDRWSMFYDDNRLAFDPVSSVLSRILPSRYPYNFNHDKPSPIIPREITPEIVSYKISH